jgi:hypothetical protein
LTRPSKLFTRGVAEFVTITELPAMYARLVPTTTLSVPPGVGAGEISPVKEVKKRSEKPVGPVMPVGPV